MNDLEKIIADAVKAGRKLLMTAQELEPSRRVAENARAKAEAKPRKRLDIGSLTPRISENRYQDKPMLEFVDSDSNVRHIFRSNRSRSGWSPFKSFDNMKKAAEIIQALPALSQRKLRAGQSDWGKRALEVANKVGRESGLFNYGAVQLAAIYCNEIISLKQ